MTILRLLTLLFAINFPLFSQGYLLFEESPALGKSEGWEAYYYHYQSMDPFYVQFPTPPQSISRENATLTFVAHPGQKSLYLLSIPKKRKELPTGDRSALNFIFRELKREGNLNEINIYNPKIFTFTSEGYSRLSFTYHDPKTYGKGKGRIALLNNGYAVLIATGDEKKVDYFLDSFCKHPGKIN